LDEIAKLIEPQIPALRRYAYALVRDHDAADLAVEAEVAGVQRIGVWSGGRFFPIDGAD